MKKLFGHVDFSPAWWAGQYGIVSKNPMETSMEELLETSVRKSRLLYERFGHLGLGSPDPEPTYDIPMYDGRVLVASTYGGKRPGWDPLSACYWWDKSDGVWSNVKTADAARDIPLPDWNNVPLLQESLERYLRERTSEVFRQGRAASTWVSLNFTHPVTSERREMVSYMSGVDLAPFLYGDTEFFTLLMDDEELADAVLDRCYEIASSYTQYVTNSIGLDRTKCGWASIGGDYSCLMSPELYRRYCQPRDLRRMEENRESALPFINLHSCGTSSHLYDVWAEYPDKNRIRVMQTRGISGRLRHLRECLPHTFIQWTLHQPQCDFENLPQEAVAALLRVYAADADYENLELVAIAAQPGDNTDRNIEIFYKTIEEINLELERGELGAI